MTLKSSLVVGAEKRLTDILTSAEVTPLLEGAILSGAAYAALVTLEGEYIWETAPPEQIRETAITLLVTLEGEPVGRLVVEGELSLRGYLEGIAGILLKAIQGFIGIKLKQVLTAEIHTSVVNQSYDELLETNQRLLASEGRYRELANTLEQKVEERTKELAQAHSILLQQQKMASIGQLAAGMAHEINNPLGFILSNLNTLQKYTARMIQMLDYYGSLITSDPSLSRFASLSIRKWQELKLDQICSDINALMSQSLEGADRIKKIIADLKGFSHIDDSGTGVVDLNAELDQTLNILEYRFPQGADIVKNYRELPGFCCNPAQICQLFLHVIENALEARQEGTRLIISTSANSTAKGSEAITISFADNGPGIPEGIRGRIFDPFFTTKEVGAGTGMGLTVAYDIIMSYEGNVEIVCPVGGGTIITITLPLKRNKNVTIL